MEGGYTREEEQLVNDDQGIRELPVLSSINHDNKRRGCDRSNFNFSLIKKDYYQQMQLENTESGPAMLGLQPRFLALVKGFLKKTELIEAAQPLCDASLVNTAEASHYSAWSSMSTLTRKNLARRDGNPSRYSITLEGKVLATRLLAAENNPSPVSPLPSWTSGENIRAASRTSSITTPAVSQANYQEVMEIAAGNNKHSEILSSLVSSSSCLVSSSSSVVNSSSVFKDALNSDVKTSKVVPSSSITVTTKTKQSRPGKGFFSCRKGEEILAY
nr:uncharacterized protein LOC128687812 [Cherax quadricarinatus]